LVCDGSQADNRHQRTKRPHCLQELTSGRPTFAVECPSVRTATFGRHTSDFLTSFYSWTPSNFMVEYGWTRDAARKMRMELAQQGYRRPVQMIEGNYELAPGVCPWWDSLKAGSNAAAVG